MATPGHAFYPPASDAGGSADWLFFATGDVLAGFEPGTPLPTVVRLWKLASAPDASVESVVAAIPTRGADAVGAFAVVVLGSRMTVVVRGTGSVDVQARSGTRRIDSRNMQPWYLAEFDRVTGMALGSSDRQAGIEAGPSSTDLPLVSGIIRAPWLAWSPLGVGESPGVPAPARPRGEGRSEAPAVVHQPSAPITGSIPVQKLAVAPGSHRTPITTPLPAIPAPISSSAKALPPLPPMPRSARPAGLASAPDPFAQSDTASLDDTVKGLGGKWTIGERAAELDSAGQGTGAEIGDTIVSSRRRHRADTPPLKAWSPSRVDSDPRFAPGGGAASIGHYSFRIGNGQVYQLDTPVYIGRKPSSPRIVTGTMPRLLKVPSPSMEVSSTHLEVRQDGATVVVTDMRSTNGTFVSQPGSTHLKLRQGESVVVVPGTLVDIGDGNVIEILPIR
ncbi:FHA domain-containing protein [Naasia lichenicola]|nr:FHA domain-containing protein [Naasia lichenicola]